MMHRVYLAGPMTGLPDFNYPAFNAEEKRIRALGYIVETTIRSCAGAWQECRRTSHPRINWQPQGRRSNGSPPSPTSLPAVSVWTCSRSPSKPFPTDQRQQARGIPMSAEKPQAAP